MKKNKLLFIIPLTPKNHGVAFLNNFLISNKYIKKNVNFKYINSSTNKKFSEIGNININKFINLIKIFFKIIFIFRKFKPDKVYVNISPYWIGFFKDIVIILILKLFVKKKIVAHIHGVGFKKLIKNKFLKLLIKKILKNVFIIFLSRSLKKDLDHIYDHKLNHFTLNNFAEYQITRKYKKKVLTIVYLANLIPSKGILTLLKVLQNLQQRKKYIFKTNIIGSTYDTKFKSLIIKESKNIKNIKFLGRLYGNKKINVLKNSNLFVYPTKNDAMPIVLIEALSVGLPIISSNLGAISDLVKHEQNGFLFQKNDVKKLQYYIEKYLKNPKMITTHSKNSKILFNKNFTKKRFLDNFLYILNNF